MSPSGSFPNSATGKLRPLLQCLPKNWMLTWSPSTTASQVPGPWLPPHDQASSSSFSAFTLALTFALTLAFCWANEPPVNAAVRAITDKQVIKIFFMMIDFLFAVVERGFQLHVFTEIIGFKPFLLHRCYVFRRNTGRF